MTVENLAYLHISETEEGSWENFGGKILGLMPVARGDFSQHSFLKMDDAPFRIMVSVEKEAKLLAAGWDAGSKSNYDALIEKLQASGAAITAGDAAGAALRCVKEYISAIDPAGNPFELFHSRTVCDDCNIPFQSPLGIKEFVTGEMGIGHAVIPAPDIDATHEFYTELLGFGDSDDLKLPPPAEGAPEMRIRFMHASNPRHHSLALANFPHPAGIVHMMVEVTCIDEVGQCLDRVEKAGIPLLASIGRHCNDNMLSFYAFGPGGIAVEYGYDGLQINDWSQFSATQSTEGDIWGHAYQAAPE